MYSHMAEDPGATWLHILQPMNPFRYSGPVPPEEVIDRDGEVDQMLNTAESANNTRLLAPREYGKTSLLGRVLAQAGAQGWAMVYVDFFGVLTLADVARRIETAYADQLSGDLARWFAGVRRRLPRVRLGGGPVPASADVELDPQAEDPLIKRLAMPRQILEKSGRRTLVVFDEFQAVLTARSDSDEVIRSEIQHHGDSASYIFAGSEVGMMRELFESRRRAFYRQARHIDLRPLEPDDLGEYISARFEQTGRAVSVDALSALLDLCQGHPRASMLVAHGLWSYTEPRGEADLECFQSAERDALEQAAVDLRGLWRGLSRTEQGLATALARGEAPFSRTRSDAGNRGEGARGALNSLMDRGEVVREGKRYHLVDPLFAELLRRNWQP
jgi:uncharacterized protein